MALFPILTEQRIKDAIDDGAFDNLEGAGQPLPTSEWSGPDDPVTLFGYRLMAEAGAVPEELRLRRALEDARAKWRKSEDPQERERLMAEIAELGMRHGLAVEQRRRGRG
ncbi:hypothetical protein ROJ8625_04042 [Roseivivax jejudonensis]|uniref:DnaJ homologue subfamily C member 28 conserved domain-containing protein n=1 Tax=Roseivivax jejudonensis TaxID=1529041 RepID=A0A1X7AAR1_9RHOB|nr:DUF1992 domain-containing protein [Roseivivax jejudonensis]SLN74328.1 hypothetical protein ROJ8625_04042 [Roseivivax jejudonensis]